MIRILLLSGLFQVNLMAAPVTRHCFESYLLCRNFEDAGVALLEAMDHMEEYLNDGEELETYFKIRPRSRQVAEILSEILAPKESSGRFVDLAHLPLADSEKKSASAAIKKLNDIEGTGPTPIEIHSMLWGARFHYDAFATEAGCMTTADLRKASRRFEDYVDDDQIAEGFKRSYECPRLFRLAKKPRSGCSTRVLEICIEERAELWLEQSLREDYGPGAPLCK